MRRATLLFLAARAAADTPSAWGRESAVSKDVEALRRMPAPCDLKKLEPKGSLLVFTSQRSGSRWFVDTLGERSGDRITSKMYEMSIHNGRLGNMYFDSWAKDHSACESGKVNKRCTCALAEAFKGEVENVENAHNTNRAPGFKYMMDHHELAGSPPKLNGLVASVCDLKVPFIIYLRRNVLRRIISKAAMAFGAHVNSTAKAAQLRKHKPRLKAARLVSDIRTEEHDNALIVKLFKVHCGGEWDIDKRVHYYENLVDANPESRRHWGDVLYELGVFNTSNATEIETRLGGWDVRRKGVIIHGATPVLETVANPEEVEAAIAPSEFRWMLER